VGQPHDRANDLERARVVADATHERGRDLDRIPREAVQHAQRRRARAEGVDVRPHARLLERHLQHAPGGVVRAPARKIML
jgi:hypothetical protein